jgi:hypothetical protein
MRQATLLAILALALAPAAARAESFEYLTSYVGSYSFFQHFKAAPNRPDGLDTVQDYGWAVYDYDRVTLHPDHSFTSSNTRFIAAGGSVTIVQVQGSDMPGGPFTTTTDCRIASDATPVTSASEGTNVAPLTAASNPVISVGWEIPDYGSQRANGAPPFRLTGTADPDCPSVFGNSFLRWTDTEPAAAVITALPSTKEMSEAFGSAANVHYRDLPFHRRFRDVTINGTGSRPGFTGPATEQAQVKVDSSVSFLVVSKPGPRPKPKLDKLIGLYLEDGGIVEAIYGSGMARLLRGSGGDEETVLVPGMGPGDVSLDVSGRVLQNRAHVRAGAAQSVLLASAKGRSKRMDRPVALKLVPTAAGRALGAAAHPAISARVRLSFRPQGSKRSISRSVTVTIPAQS